MTLPRLAALFRFSSDYLRGTGLVLALIADALDEQQHADPPAREEGERADADVRPRRTNAEMRAVVERMRAEILDSIALHETGSGLGFDDAPCSDPDCSTCKPN